MNSPFFDLTPDQIMLAVESCGFQPTGQYFQLNSYENRVFEVFLEEPTKDRVIIKFYRPGRWSKDEIAEEHSFMHDLAEAGVPIGKAVSINFDADLPPTLGRWEGIYFCVYRKWNGRALDEISDMDLTSIGRQLATIHNVGAKKKYRHRPHLFDSPSLDAVFEAVDSAIFPELKESYLSAAEAVYDFLDSCPLHGDSHRIHGDIHRGNILKRQAETTEFIIVDFDDSVSGPAVQDFWMLTAKETQHQDLEKLLKGYEEFRTFPQASLELVEPLRGLRILKFAHWVATRWHDPSFPRLFPQFHTYAYWAEETRALEYIANQL